MKYRQLADTGVFVSELCLGAMTFGGRGGMWEVIAGLDQAGVDAIVHRSLDAGINFIDTANVYAAGESETLLGSSLAGRRQQVVLATKVRGRMGSGANDVGLSRLHIMQAVDASLQRLGTDYIDLYQVHRFDALTNLEDTLRALDDLVRAGKVRYIGCSNYAAWQIMKALAISKEQHLERFRCTQSYYSLAGRDLEREIVPLVKDQNLGLLVWSPLAGGFLSGKFTRTGGDEAARRATFDFPPGEQGEGVRHHRRPQGDCRCARRQRGAGGDRVAAGATGHDQRHHRRPPARPARGQPEGGGTDAHRRGTEGAG